MFASNKYLVGAVMCPSWKMMEWKSMGRMTTHIWNGKKSTCLKPPTSDVLDLLINEPGFDPVISENSSDGRHNRDWCEEYTVAVAVFCTDKSRSSTPNVSRWWRQWLGPSPLEPLPAVLMPPLAPWWHSGPKHVQTQSILRFPQKIRAKYKV